MELSSHRSIQEYFHDAVCTAMRNQNVDASELAEFYLVNLLSDYAKQPLDDQPLALRLSEAATALPDARVKHLRVVGDQSLYVSGFFSDSLQRSLVDVDYYIRIGGTAYGQLARMNTSMGDVYVELADKFGRFVDVLAEISKGSAMTSPRGVVQLYEKWLKTRDEWIERKLREQGVLPAKGDPQ